MKLRAIVLIAAAALSIGAAAASAAPVCGAWGASTSEGKKEKTIDGKKHICDASSKSRSCCTYGAQTTCYTEKQTTYDNCTPASASGTQPKWPHFRPPSQGILETSPGSPPQGPSRPGMSLPTAPPATRIN